MILRNLHTRDLPDWLAAASGVYRRELLPNGCEVLTEDPDWHAAPEDATWVDLGEGWQCWCEPGDTPPLRRKYVDDEMVERVLSPDGSWLPVIQVSGLHGESWRLPVVRDRSGTLFLEQPWGVDEDGAPCRAPTSWQRRLITVTDMLDEILAVANLEHGTISPPDPSAFFRGIGIVLQSVYCFPVDGFLHAGLLDDRMLGRVARMVCGYDSSIPIIGEART